MVNAFDVRGAIDEVSLVFHTVWLFCVGVGVKAAAAVVITLDEHAVIELFFLFGLLLRCFDARLSVARLFLAPLACYSICFM